ncbi:MAG: replication-relaxation family protein [Ktedonobacteraceae bacterium]|nr:replication-relaxation family protein [Ktedonobacteraceae bacterium]
MIVQNRAGETIEADIEERGPLADRLLFWLLKHPYQRVCDLSFVFQISTSTIWRQLQTLIRQALLECIRSTNVTSSRHPDTLYYLTSQGIAHIADLVGGIDATRLAHMWKANETTYLRLLPRLQSYLSLHDAILRLIADAPRQLAYPGGYPATIRWHWQHDYVHPFERKKKRLTFRADGAVVFRRRPLRQAIQGDDTDAWYCLFWLVDPGFRGSEDLHLMRERLEHLLLWRESSERWSFYQSFPQLLIVAPTVHQRDLWVYCAQEAAAHLRVAPLKGACAMQMDGSPWRFLWHSLDGSGAATLQSLAIPLVPQAIPPGLLAPRPIEPGLGRRGKQSECKVIIGTFEARAKQLNVSEHHPKTTAEIALLSMQLSHRHRDLLRHIYALPLIAAQELATLLQRDHATQQRYLYDLHQLCCIETIETARGKRLVLTEVGLRLISFMLGVQLIHIAERDPSTHIWQQRGVRHMLHTTEHTAGIYTFLAQTQMQARKTGQGLLWWETTRSFRRYHLQGAWHNLMPDALFAYQAKEAQTEAWLEWDTGSMHLKPMTVKFEAYAQYVRSQHYRQEHIAPPKLLIVTPHHGREQSLRRVATPMLGALSLRVWTTTEPLLQVQGPLGSIWKPLQSSREMEEGGARSMWIEEG